MKLRFGIITILTLILYGCSSSPPRTDKVSGYMWAADELGVLLHKKENE